MVSWVETLKGTLTELGSSSHISTVRIEGGVITLESKVGNSNSGENQIKGLGNLPYPEYSKRREEDRCFQCRGPYSLGHKCLEKNLRVLILEENDEEEELEEWEEKDQNQMELSVFFFCGRINPNKYYEVTRIVARKKSIDFYG